ncbi:hypothetical protein FDECE_3776 [Fusarium decemcellulare]|nr:hypothetical protein FDECE_3776 [Fusarium decemcellulare]
MDSIPASTSDETSAKTTSASPSDTSTTDPYEISSAEKKYLKNYEDFIEELKKATHLLLHAGKRRYRHVTGLVTCWPNTLSDRKHIRMHAQDLCRVLRDQYKFDVAEKPYEMDKTRPHSKLNYELGSILEKNAPEPPEKPGDRTNLFILYYGGHAVEKNGNWVWRPKENAEAQVEVSWTSLLAALDDYDYDFLFLFDCCYGSYMIDPGRKFKQRCEILSASERGEKASGKEEHSFTRALVSELKIEAEAQRTCEIMHLHSTLNLREKRETYNLIFEPFWERFGLGDTTICLAPMGDDVETILPKSEKEIVQSLKRLSDIRVVFKASFKNPKAEPFIQQWKEFLRWRPRNLSDIDWYAMDQTHFETVFKTNSSSAIISMPMILWDSMPKQAAYEFICIARSIDLLGGSTNMLGKTRRPNQALWSTYWRPTAHSSGREPGSGRVTVATRDRGVISELPERPAIMASKGHGERSSAQPFPFVAPSPAPDPHVDPSMHQRSPLTETEGMGQPGSCRHLPPYIMAPLGLESGQGKKMLQHLERHEKGMQVKLKY